MTALRRAFQALDDLQRHVVSSTAEVEALVEAADYSDALVELLTAYEHTEDLDAHVTRLVCVVLGITDAEPEPLLSEATEAELRAELARRYRPPSPWVQDPTGISRWTRPDGRVWLDAGTWRWWTPTDGGAAATLEEAVERVEQRGVGRG